MTKQRQWPVSRHFVTLPEALGRPKLGTTDSAREVTVELTSGAVRGVEVESGVENLQPERSEILLRNGRLEAVELLIELIELIGSNDVRSLEELSKKEGKTPQEIWANICKARGFELCTIPERVLTAGRPG